jgi:hypothetical protein
MTGEFVGLIPEEFLDPEKKREFLLWLLRLPVDEQTKKYILIDWTRLVGVALTEDMVDFITGGHAEITRG